MEITQLRHFLAVWEHRNFARAAVHSGVTQQALSASIARLEAHLAGRLFDRGRTGARPTPVAASFMPYAAHALVELELGKLAIAEEQRGDAGVVRLGVGQTFAGHIVPQALAQMTRDAPHVRITVVENYCDQLAASLERGEIDFFVGAPTCRIGSSRLLDIKPMFDIVDQVICSSRHPLSRLDSVTVDDMIAFPWLFSSAPSDEQSALFRAFAEHGHPPAERVLRSDTIATAQALLIASDFLTVGQPEILAPLFEAGYLTTLKTSISLPRRYACLGTRRNTPQRPAVARMIALIEARSAAFKAALNAGSQPERPEQVASRRAAGRRQRAAPGS